MTTYKNDADEPFTKDDEDWLAVLSGKLPSAEVDPKTVEEARMFRSVLRQRAQTTLNPSDDEGFQRLEKKLEEELGDFKPPVEPNWWTRLKSSITEITERLTWKNLSLATAYSMLLMLVSNLATLWYVASQSKEETPSASPQERSAIKSGESSQMPNSSDGPVLFKDYPAFDPQRSAKEFKEEFLKHGGNPDDLKISEQWHPIMIEVSIKMFKTPATDLRKFYEDQGIEPPYPELVLISVRPK